MTSPTLPKISTTQDQSIPEGPPTPVIPREKRLLTRHDAVAFKILKDSNPEVSTSTLKGRVAKI